MFKGSVQRLKENYKYVGNLTDAQFIVVKACASEKKLIHAEKITDVIKITNGMNESITLDDIEVGDDVRIKSTVRSMVGETEKTGYVALKNIQDIHHDEYIGMLIIDADGVIFTTMDCKDEVYQLNTVIREDNWVNPQSLSELIEQDVTLKDFQHIRDGGREFDRASINFNEPQMPDLMF